jgi:hypothetical protein
MFDHFMRKKESAMIVISILVTHSAAFVPLESFATTSHLSCKGMIPRVQHVQR